MYGIFTYIYLHVNLPQKSPSYVGKYTSTMEHLGEDIPKSPSATPFASPGRAIHARSEGKIAGAPQTEYDRTIQSVNLHIYV